MKKFILTVGVVAAVAVFFGLVFVVSIWSQNYIHDNHLHDPPIEQGEKE